MGVRAVFSLLGLGSLGLAIALGAAGCSTSSASVAPGANATESDVLVGSGNNAFALRLYEALGRADEKANAPRSNLFVSPFSISTALAMTYAGARGETAKEMAETLGLPNDPSVHAAFQAVLERLNGDGARRGCELVVANRLWAEESYEISAAYRTLTQTHYDAGMEPLAFVKAPDPSREHINAWVEKATREKIKDLLPPGVVTTLTRLVLTNAIYFKGDWALPFEPKRTREEKFETAPGENVDVAMMHANDRFRYYEDDDVRALELRYEGEQISMLAVLPKTRHDLASAEAALLDLGGLVAGFSERTVDVSFPKLKITSSLSLKTVLQSMGMVKAFEFTEADFTGMTPERGLAITAVVHKAFVDVNETGTEAAAATGAVVSLSSESLTPPPRFRADHPFVFALLDKRSGSILFLGRVVDPSKTAD